MISLRHPDVDNRARPANIFSCFFTIRSSWAPEKNLLREIARIENASPRTPDACPPVLLKVRHYIESEYDKSITLKHLEDMAHVSVPHLCLQFKKYFKTLPIAYLIRQRMHQAACFLQDKNLKISAVAHQVGHDVLFYFSKLFKKHYGLSPRALRQLATKK